MIVEAGHFALVLALALALVQGVVGLWAGHSRDAALTGMTRAAATGAFLFTALAFAALTHAYLVSDFSVANVIQNSHSTKPLIYKISGVWGNHEGSMLLWVLVLALFAALVAWRRELPDVLRANVLAVQGLIAVAFLLFILLTSNPFWRVDPAPFEGRDLNPILQDPGLAIHPPLLYLGYVGFSIAFSFAVAALIDGRIDAVWARIVRPWTLVAWIFLTLGISMGSYWAYYELGWGGFWFWDPVENASLMPWLAGTALLHSTIVMEKREALKVWTVLLAIITFSLSLVGTFLVRSGVLTSVHSFASDPARGVFILGILCVTIGGSLALYAWRAPGLKQGGLFAPISREGALVLNNLFLTVACAAVLIGTLYPLALEALTGAKISVGPPFFNLTVLPLMAPLTIAIPVGQMLAWKRGDLGAAMQRLWAAALLSIFAAVLILAFTHGGPWFAPLAVAAGVWLIAGSFEETFLRIWKRGQPFANTWSRAKGLPRAAYGMAVAHAGVGITVIGLASTAWHSEAIVDMQRGTIAKVGAYSIRLDGLQSRTSANFREDVASFSILDDNSVIGQTESAKRIYTARNMPTTEAGLWTRGFSQVYVSVGEIESNGAVAVRAYHKPMVLLIWIGSLFMALGGFLSLSDRRRRIGVPQGARRTPVLAPAE